MVKFFSIQVKGSFKSNFLEFEKQKILGLIQQTEDETRGS